MLWSGIYQKEKLADFQKLFHVFFVKAMKTLAKLKLLWKEWNLVMGKDSKHLVNSILLELQNKEQVKRYFTDIIINISFLFYFFPFFDHKRT